MQLRCGVLGQPAALASAAAVAASAAVAVAAAVAAAAAVVTAAAARRYCCRCCRFSSSCAATGRSHLLSPPHPPISQADVATSMNAFYLMYAGALVFMMQAGFAMLCAGCLRMKVPGGLEL